MAKILGFTNNFGEDWFVSSEYATKEIQDIPDPEGGHALNAPTSIPSPFARMDLVRKSFQNIGETPQLTFFQRGKKVVASKEDEKTVSQCLDLAELLFFHDNFKNAIEIIEWNRISQIANLKQSSNPGHQKLGDVLDMYLRQDAGAFNFDLLDSIYIIKYNYKVIGGTSPLTLLFNTANDGAALNLKSTKGKTFFKDIVPLYERDEDFQKYLYLLFESDSRLKERMYAFAEYLKKNLDILSSVNDKLYRAINTQNITDLNHLHTNLFTKDAGQVVEVFGVPFKIMDLTKIPVNDSDFLIHSSKYVSGNKPLVLQNNFNKAFKYVNGNWNSTIQVPYVDANSVQQRTLPGLNIKYPYLTVNDFLEDTLIRLVYPIDGDNYFDGNLKLHNPEDPKGYLLPIKPLFFEFFNIRELTEGGLGKPQISIEEGLKESVRVLLKIPIKNGDDHIIFERVYHNETAADLTTNKGAIIEQQVGVTLFPFLRYSNEATVYYSVQVVDRNITGNLVDIDYVLNFFSDHSKVALQRNDPNYRTKKVKGDFTKVSTSYYDVNSHFDYIQVDSKFGKGLIIPKWKSSHNTGDEFTFAVDFGTTNTHIEYSINNSNPKPFDITAEDIQAVSLINDKIEHNFSGTGAIDIRTLVAREFLPKIIKQATVFSFPIRTALSQSKSNAPQKGGRVFTEFNIPFIFEKDVDNNSKFFTNLKWDSKEANNDYRISAFLEQIILMIRSKVILNGGNLAKTKLIWTYPISMSTIRKDRLGEKWNELFNKYFGIGETVRLSESLAPYYYFKSNGALEGLGFGTSVLMDIGGGTSDVVVYKDNVPTLVTSYKFAGNTIFGDGFSEFGNVQNNKLVLKYKADFDSLLEKENSSLKNIAETLYQSQKSSDYNAFLFSLANNIEIKSKDLLNYNKRLTEDEDLKIIFLYFYASKVYHIAKLMEHHNLDLPANLIFSGNGSKMLNIISSNLSTISEFSKIIFLKVFEVDKYPEHSLKISIEKEIPKAITSKGSIVHLIKGNEEIDVKNIEKTFTSLEGNGITSLTEKDIATESVRKSIVTAIEEFNNFFITVLDSFNCEDKFGISHRSVSIFKTIANKNLSQYLQAGLAYNQSLEGSVPKETAVVRETLFFLPMVETIQQLINELAVEEAEI